MQPTMQAPSFLANRASRGLTAHATAGIGGAQPPRISIRANQFTLIDGAGNKRPHTVTMIDPRTQAPAQFLSSALDVIFVGLNMSVSKVYYDTDYDPSAEDAPPACFSDNGVGPSTMASSPQSLHCANCPNNQWGSAISNASGKQTKLCSDSKKVAVILPGDPILYQFRVPPATLKNLKVYANTIAGYSIQGADGTTRGADLADVVTRITFDGQGVMKFEAVAFIDESIAQQMDAITEEKMSIVIGTNDKPIDALPAPKAPAAIAAPHTQAAPVQQPMIAPPSPAQPAPVQQFAPPPQTYPGAPGTQFVYAPPVQTAPGGAPAPVQQFAPPAPPQAAPQPQAAPEAPKTRRGRGRATAAPAPAQTAPQPQVAPVQAPQVVTGPPAMAMPPTQQFAPAPVQAAPQQPQAAPVQQWVPPSVAAPPGVQQPQAAPVQQFGMQPQAPAPDASMQAAVLDAMNFRPQG